MNIPLKLKCFYILINHSVPSNNLGWNYKTLKTIKLNKSNTTNSNRKLKHHTTLEYFYRTLINI